MRADLRYLLVFFGLLGGVLTIVGGLNFVVDPYGVNHLRPLLSPYKAKIGSRIQAAELLRRGCRTIVIGPEGIQSLAQDSEVFRTHVCNVVLDGAGLEEIEQVFDYALDMGSAKRVLLFLELAQFNTRRTPGPAFHASGFDRSRPWLDHRLGVLFGVGASRASAAVLWRWRRHRPVRQVPKRSFTAGIRRALNDPKTYRGLVWGEPERVRLAHLARIATEQRVILKVALSPMHVMERGALVGAGLEDTWDAWKRDVVTTISAASDQASVYDFAVIDETTTSRPESGQWFVGGRAINARQGRRVLKALNVRNDRHLIDAEQLDARLLQDRVAFAAFEQKHPGVSRKSRRIGAARGGR